MHEFLSDPRYGVRVLARRPGFTLVAVLALALGIGANTAIFSVVNTVLLQPLPYDDPGRLVTVRETFVPRFPVFAVTRLISRVEGTDYHIPTSRDGPDDGVQSHRGRRTGALPGARVSADFFEMLGVPLALGRGFSASEMEPGRDLAVVLSYGLWQRRFGGDPICSVRQSHSPTVATP